ncbi:hypothetical protein JCM17823_13820 [Halorubrum gandharaense]
MDSVGSPREFRRDPEWRYPFAVGSVSLLICVGVQLSSTAQNAAAVPLLAGAIAGAALWETVPDTKTLGWRTGLITGGAVVIGALRFALQIPQAEHTLVSVTVAGVWLVIVSVLFVLVFGVLGALGAVVGGRLGRRFQHRRVSGG